MQRPFIDKSAPKVWKAAVGFSTEVGAFAAESGLSSRESELIKVRASQLNECLFCLDLHLREAREAGIPQQHLDLLSVWREAEFFSERDIAVLLIAEAATLTPLTPESEADLEDARAVLGDDAFAAAEWVAISINTFNRISILSAHPVRERTS